VTSIVCGNAAWLLQLKIMDKSAFLQLWGHYYETGWNGAHLY